MGGPSTTEKLEEFCVPSFVNEATIPLRSILGSSRLLITIESYSKVQATGGESCEMIPRPTSLPTGLEGWFEAFAFPFFAVLVSPDCELCEVDMKDERSGEWMVMYVRLRFKVWKD
ncbi:hypothetical protein JCM5353_003353 [Sporobolomyces roseus]